MDVRARAAVIATGSVAMALCGMGIATAAGHAGGSTHHVSKGNAAAGPRSTLSISPDEGVFTPITPCRIVDTRAQGGEVSSARSFVVSGSGSLASQGGSSTGCGIPASATAIAANVLSTGSTRPGFVRGYPAGATAPNASLLNFAAGQTIANGLSLAVRPGTAPGLTVAASSPTQVVIDVTGYYAPQITAYVNLGGKIGTGTARVLGISHTSGSGYYVLTVDRNVFDCTVSATEQSPGSYISAITGDNDTVDVNTWQLSSTAEAEPTDEAFNVTVNC